MLKYVSSKFGSARPSAADCIKLLEGRLSAVTKNMVVIRWLDREFGALCEFN